MNEALRNALAGLLLGAMLAVGIIGATRVGLDGVARIKAEDRVLEVKGYAEKKIDSDLAIWNAQVTTQAPTIAEAFRALERDTRRVTTYLVKQGVKKEALTVQPVSTQQIFERLANGVETTNIIGYRLSRPLEVRTTDVATVATAAEGVSQLLESGIELQAQPLAYFYTRVNDLKVEMLALATRDARRRAEALTSGSGNKVGSLRAASQGVFQITAVASTEVSDYGTYDTSTREKMIKAVVTVSYALE